MTEKFLTTYFMGIATSNKLIRHTIEAPAFFKINARYDLDSFDEALRSMTSTVAMLLEIGEGDFGSWDTPTDTGTIGIHILFKCVERAEIEPARDQAKDELKQVLARIRFDCRDGDLSEDGTDGPLRAAGIQFSSSGKYSDIDGADTWYGKSLYIQLNDKQEDFIYNPDKWL